MIKATIAGIEGYLPTQRRTNQDLVACNPTWSADEILKKTGIAERRVAGSDECVSDLAVRAAEGLFARGIGNPAEIDALLLCTQSPDHFLPTTACMVQARLGLTTNCACFDFNLGCSGFVYGLWMARGMIQSGQAKNVLLITSEVYTKHLSVHDFSVATVFGDGAAATLVSASEEAEAGELGAATLGTDGRGAKHLIVPAGGMRLARETEEPPEPNADTGFVRSRNDLYMNGPEVFRFVLVNVPRAIRELLAKEELTLDDIDLVFFHQASAMVLDHLSKMLALPESKVPRNLELNGNTVSATIPLLIRECEKNGTLTKGKLCLLVGFGVGFSWAASLVRW